MHIGYVKKSISIPPPVYDWLHAEADRLGLSLSGAISQLVIENMRRGKSIAAKARGGQHGVSARRPG
jgi:macrodomain Ter protein organizer (MatP/YcbG family)